VLVTNFTTKYKKNYTL